MIKLKITGRSGREFLDTTKYKTIKSIINNYTLISGDVVLLGYKEYTIENLNKTIQLDKETYIPYVYGCEVTNITTGVKTFYPYDNYNYYSLSQYKKMVLKK